MKAGAGPSTKNRWRTPMSRPRAAPARWLYALGVVVGAGALAWTTTRSESERAPVDVTVYKHAACDCCVRWVEHMRQSGFRVTVQDVERLGDIRAKYGVPGELAACHTALANGYVIEGHVPADAVRKLLDDRPQLQGIAVPGMPSGAPGMEGSLKVRYTVFAFGSEGKWFAYQRR